MESLGKFLPCNLVKQKMIHCVQNSIELNTVTFLGTKITVIHSIENGLLF